MDFVTLDTRSDIMGRVNIRGHVHAAVLPGSHPRMTFNDDVVSPPPYHHMAPSPRSEGSTDHDCGPKSNHSGDVEARTRGHEHNSGIVIRDIDVARHCRKDLNIVGSNHLHGYIRITAQIAVLIGPLPHSLHRIHHIATLV